MGSKPRALLFHNLEDPIQLGFVGVIFLLASLWYFSYPSLVVA